MKFNVKFWIKCFQNSPFQSWVLPSLFFFLPFFFVCVRTLRWHCIGLCPFERLHNDIYKNTTFTQNRLKTTKYLRLISSVKLPFVFKCINCIFYWCKKRFQSIDRNALSIHLDEGRAMCFFPFLQPCLDPSSSSVFLMKISFILFSKTIKRSIMSL